VARLSLWKEGKHTNDFKFHDRVISEQFTVGGTGVFIHKYLGPGAQADTGDPTQPGISDPTELDIQDILFMENRDRKYAQDIYKMRCMYKLSDTEFDLSQFGLFLSQDMLFITFHLKDMYDTLGRKLMAGDVLEMPHLNEYYHLDESVPHALRKYYLVQEGNRPAEGFSPTWWPHLWRVKVTPLVDSEEIEDLLEHIGCDGEPLDDILADPSCKYPPGESIDDKLLDFNDKIVEEAENQVPASGYDTTSFYVAPVDENGDYRDPKNLRADLTIIPFTTDPLTADNGLMNADVIGQSPVCDIQSGRVYLLGDGHAPNGYPVTEAIDFPEEALIGDFVLRIDYLPNRLFRYNGKHWVKVEDAVRTTLTAGRDETLLGGFVNNENVSNGKVTDNCKGTTEERQVLSEILRPKADN